MKRGFDVVFSFFGLVLLSPVLLAVSVFLLIKQGRPLFFGQTRIGRHGAPFVIWKFRTMVPNAAAIGLAVTSRNDSRVTPAGRWLRDHKLDELPQLWNVLGGDMSFVGPRPEVSRYVATYDAEQRQVLELKPGITDLATLEFVDEEDLLAQADNREEFYVQHCIPKKIALNLQYARRAGMLADLGIIVRTLARLARF